MHNDKTSCISVDNYAAQYDAARKTILDNNCKRVLYIAGKREAYVTDERLRAMYALRDDLGLTLMIRNGEFSEKKAREITFRYGANKDIVVCASDLMSIGAMNALTEMDIFRPVCGFDGASGRRVTLPYELVRMYYKDIIKFSRFFRKINTLV